MDNKLKKILVTGGAGYIGSVLVGQLLADNSQMNNAHVNNYFVRTIDNLSFGGNALLPYLNNPHFEFIKGDICRAKDIETALNDIDTVIHLAAIVGDPACKKYPGLAEKVNKEGAELLCDMSFNKNVKRFIFISTCSNYGKMDNPDGFVDENSPLKPVSLYAELKVNFENYLMNKDKKSFSPVCLRFATAYGLSLRPRFDLTVNEFTKILATGKTLEVYGEEFWRPYCHTTDLANACITALEADQDKVRHQAFNVGVNDENYQKKTLVDMILNELPEMKDKVRYVHRDEDPRDYRVNFDKIKNILGFTNTKKVIDGIRELIFVIKSGLIKNPNDRFYYNI